MLLLPRGGGTGDISECASGKGDSKGVPLFLFSVAGRHKVVAIDTEHHAYDSYRGFVCLVQLSTCSSAGAAKDFLVDPFCLFDELTHLNRLTADPNILKIIHGANSDVIWLQVRVSFHMSLSVSFSICCLLRGVLSLPRD